MRLGRAGVLSQWLGAWTTGLGEDTGSFPSSHTRFLQFPVTGTPGGSYTSCLHGYLHSHAHAYICDSKNNKNL